VRTGEIAVDLARPLDLQLSWWVRDLGRAAFALPTRGLAPLLVGALTVGVALSKTWTSYPLGLVSLLLGVSVSFLCRYGMNLVAFWTLDVKGFLNLYILMLGLLSGFYLPVHVFPGWLQAVAFASPFPAMFQAPIDVMSGRVIGPAAWQVIAGQAGWVIGLIVLTRVVLWRATRRLVVQGG
jgi:ABC-2 type transport system permease protein